MLPRKYRLTGSDNFVKIYKQGSKIWSPFFLLLHLPLEGQTTPRIGIVASKKVGGAVERNRAKRVLRAAISANIELFKPNYNYVFIANSKTATLTSAQLSNEIINSAKKF
jgi:ribonuclease P protein component